MANFGIPYMGSKDSIIHKIAPLFPVADNFYDLFGGGFSVTHYMLFHHKNKYKNFIYNEIKSDLVDLVKRAIQGEFNYDKFKPEWISKEEFLKRKDTDAYVRLLWSFGNNQKAYLFSEENERNKKSLHNAVVFNQFDDLAKSILKISTWPNHLSIRGRRLACRSIVIKRQGELQQLQQLQQLERLERLERLQRLERLELSSKSYDEVEIKPNSVIYCDPPYKDTCGYLSEFDHDKFWRWVLKQEQPVFVSEYQAPPRLNLIAAFHKKTRLSHKGMTDTKPEKVFGNDSAYDLFKNKRLVG